MWRRVFALLMLATFTEGQMAAAMTGPQVRPAARIQQASATQPKIENIPAASFQSGAQTLLDATAPQAPAPVVSSYQRYSELRRGREEEVVVLLCKAANRVRPCPLGPESQAGLVPLALELKPEEGFTVRYRQDNEFRSQQQAAPVHAGIGSEVFRLKIRAEKNVALGTHQLQGRLTFQSVNAGELSEPQHINVVIPVTVVEHDGRVQKARWSLEKPKQFSFGDMVLIVLTSPFWGPLFLMFLLECKVEGCN